MLTERTMKSRKWHRRRNKAYFRWIQKMVDFFQEATRGPGIVNKVFVMDRESMYPPMPTKVIG